MTKLVRANYQPPTYITPEIFLSFDIHTDHTTVIGIIKYKLNNGKPGDPLVLDGGKLNAEEFNQGKTKFLSASINGFCILASMKESLDNEFQTFTIPDVPAEGELRITTQLDPCRNNSCEGLYRSGELLLTQCEAQGFRKIIPYIDRPDNLAKFTVTITANQLEFPILLSNGNLISQAILVDNRHQVTYQDPFAKPSYLFALVAGKLACLSDYYFTKSKRKINLFVHVKSELVGKAMLAMQALKEAMAWDEEQYDLEYDLDNCHLVGVANFNAGAMENKGLIIFNDDCLISDPRMSTDEDQKYIYLVVAHEYFHNYAGNRVTVREWLELALKEGLATKKETDFIADIFGYAETRISTIQQLRNVQFAEDAGPLAHAVRPDAVDSIDNIYTDTIYGKGAELLNMLSRILGRPLFTQGVKHYFKTYDGQAVTIENFINAQEYVSGRNLQQFLEWYKHPGTPKIAFYETYNPVDKIYTLQIKQSNTNDDGSERPPLHIPIAIGLLNSKGEDMIPTRLIELTENDQTFNFTDISEQPIPSLLRDFTASVIVATSPVHFKLHAVLFLYDSDPINRWLAGYELKLAIIKQLVFEYDWHSSMESSTNLNDNYETSSIKIFKQCFGSILTDPTLSIGMKVKLLEIPDAQDLLSEFKTVNVESLLYATQTLKMHIAASYGKQLLDIYEQVCTRGNDELTPNNADMRQMRNLALEYLLIADPEHGIDLALLQYNSSTNMTCQLGALNLIATQEYYGSDEIAPSVLQEFYLEWQHNSLVVLKYFKVIASSQRRHALAELYELFSSPSFDIKNPNHIYATVRHFAQNNFKHFHNLDGHGYELVANKIIEIEKFNPSVASNIVEAFADWQKFDITRQRLMIGQLLKIKSLPYLSTATSETLTKILGGITQVPEIIDRAASAVFISPMFDSITEDSWQNAASPDPVVEVDVAELGIALQNVL